jgi:uncharacterized protein YndB with AHSA1/START domain
MLNSHEGTFRENDLNEDKVRAATGKSLKQWNEILDADGCRGKTHKEIADMLHGNGMDYWWAQTVTVEYERHIGRRVLGETADGTFQLGARKTIAVSPEVLWNEIRSALEFQPASHGASGEVTTLEEGSHLRMRWSEPGWESHSILQLRVESTAPGRSVLSVHHEKLPDAASRETLLERWKSVLAGMQIRLEAAQNRAQP